MATITVMGNVCNDLEIKTSKSGNEFVSFGLAENIYSTEKKDYETIFYQCVAFNEVANQLVKLSIKKGSGVQVQGRFAVKDYTRKDGTESYKSTITVTDLCYLPFTKKKDKDENYLNQNSKSNAPNEPDEVYASEDDDDDLPF